MKLAEFDSLVKELLFESGRFPDKEIVDIYFKSTGRRDSAKLVAYSMWIAEAPEDERTDIIRKQLIHMESEGMFNFSGD